MNEYYKLEIINVTNEYIFVDLGDGIFKKIEKKILNFEPEIGNLVSIYYNQDDFEEIFVKLDNNEINGSDGLPF